MLKELELTNSSSCLNKAKKWEPVFVLLGHDESFAATVRFWIQERIRLKLNAAHDHQLAEAEAIAKLSEWMVLKLAAYKKENSRAMQAKDVPFAKPFAAGHLPECDTENKYFALWRYLGGERA